jgi:hypothetical protein
VHFASRHIKIARGKASPKPPKLPRRPVDSIGSFQESVYVRGAGYPHELDLTVLLQ